MTGPPDRVIRDEVHRDVLVPAACFDLDTREFQRLRYVKQLATCEFVFPSATHNRFAHSLGAYHLAGRLSAPLRKHIRDASTHWMENWCNWRPCSMTWVIHLSRTSSKP